MQGADIWAGETIHSARGGCALTLQMLGVSNSDINTHIGWSTHGMIHRYTQRTNMMGNHRVATALSNLGSSAGLGVEDSASEVHGFRARLDKSAYSTVF